MSGFKAGLVDSALHTRFSPELMLRSTRQLAVAGGADSMWVPDHLNSIFPASIWKREHLGAAALMPRADACYEPWTALGYVASQNKLSRLRLGVSVTDTGRRNPAVTAQAAATLHQLSRGRAILGIGPGEREGNAPYGVDWERPVGRFAEAIATIRALWDADGRPVTRDSEFFPLRDAVFAIPPYRGRWPEIWIAGHGPRMLRVTGRYADAWFPAYALRPSEYAERLAVVRTAASDSGRDPAAVTPAAFLFVMTASSGAQVDEMVGSLAARLFTLTASGEVWARHGAEHPMGSGFSGIQDLLPQTIDEPTALDCADRVPPSLVRASMLAGTPSEVLEQLAEWRDNGLRYVVLAGLGFVHPRLRVGLASSWPMVQVLRGARRL
ncbi:LLM class flavin-dependent oxidoreductase [Rhodococcus sp. NPDC054953]